MILYLLQFFPKLSEAFILDELCEMDRAGLSLRIWALGRWPEEKSHPESLSLMDRVTYLDREGPGKRAKALSLLQLGTKRPGAALHAHRLFRGQYKERFGFTYTQSIPRALDLLKLGVTHIHAHFAYECADHALALSLLSGIPFSLTTHGSDLLVDPHPHFELFAEHASAVISPSANNAKILRNQFGVPNDRIRVIPNGVNLERFQPGDLADKKPGTILTVARLHEVKGLCHLIDAYAVLRDREIPFQGVLVGEGPERPALEAQIRRLRLGDRVTLSGDLPRDAVLAHLRAAEIFALSSLSEGLPVSVIEAMASGLPVVAPDITGLPELVEEGRTGLLVPPENPEALAGALERLLTNADLHREMAHAGRKRAEDRFSLARMVKDRLELFTAERD